MDLVVFAIFTAMFYGILFITYFERMEDRHQKEMEELRRRYEIKSEFYIELVDVLERIEMEES